MGRNSHRSVYLGRARARSGVENVIDIESMYSWQSPFWAGIFGYRGACIYGVLRIYTYIRSRATMLYIDDGDSRWDINFQKRDVRKDTIDFWNHSEPCYVPLRILARNLKMSSHQNITIIIMDSR